MDLSGYFQAGHGELIATEPRVEGNNNRFSIVQREPGLFEKLTYGLRHPILYIAGKTSNLRVYSGIFEDRDSGEIKGKTVWEDVEPVSFEGVKHQGIDVGINICRTSGGEKRVVGIIDVNFLRLEIKVK